MVKLKGYINGKSKKGTDYTMIYVEKDFSSVEKANGAVGTKVSTEFMPASQVGKLTQKDIGKELSLEYDVNGGRAYLISVSVL